MDIAMDTTDSAELRAAYDAQIERAQVRLVDAEGAVRWDQYAYGAARDAGGSIDELDDLRRDRADSEIVLVRRREELDRLLDQRSNETGAPLPEDPAT
jgi:hypothetical protein